MKTSLFPFYLYHCFLFFFIYSIRNNNQPLTRGSRYSAEISNGIYKESDNLSNKLKTEFQNNCVTKVENRLVRGNSLSGLIESDASVKILFGFYDCHEVKAGDIIVYSYSGNPNPIIKIVKAVPGDRFQLRPASGGWHILVNNEILKNSRNEDYKLNERGHKMLSLYENDYKGIIPVNTYLIFGNSANGTLDSSVFGLIDQSDILGKAVF
ncbi:MAG: signal peptidase I [Patescibacteria group bacterium]